MASRVYVFRLQILIIDGGLLVLRNIIDQNLIANGITLDICLSNEKAYFTRLRSRGILTQAQYDILFPPTGQIPTTLDLDITLIICLLRNLRCFGLNRSFDWNNKPLPTDISTEADIWRLKDYRNHICHISSTTEIKENDFNTWWSDIEQILIRLDPSSSLNISKRISDFETCALDEKEEERINKEIEKWDQYEIKIDKLQEKIGVVEKNVSDMKTDVSEVKTDVSKVEADISGMDTKVSGMETKVIGMETKVSGMKTKVSGMETNLSGMETKVHGMKRKLSEMETDVSGFKIKESGMETKVHGMETKVSGIEIKVHGMEAKVSGMETNVSGMETKFSGMETKVHGMETKVSGMETKLSGMETDVSDLRRRQDEADKITLAATAIKTEEEKYQERKNQLEDQIDVENAALLDEIFELLQVLDREPEVVMLFGKTGCGKSAMFNTLHRVLTGQNFNLARQGNGNAHNNTLDLGRYDNFGIDLKTIRDNTRREKIGAVLPKLPHIIDCFGVGNVDSPELREIVELLIGGFIPKHTNIIALSHMVKEYGAGCLKTIYKKANPADKVTKVIFLQNCRDEIPKYLINCLLEVLTITDPTTLKRKYTAEIFLLITNYDIVRDPSVDVLTEMSLEEFIEVENKLARELNLIGALETNRIRWASYTDNIQDDNKYIENNALRFLKRMVEPGAPKVESGEPIVGPMKILELNILRLKTQIKQFFLQRVQLNVIPALFVIAIVFAVVIPVLYKLFTGSVYIIT